MPRLAAAHTLGMSVAEFEVAADGHVDGRVTFASAEPLGGTPLRDEDLGAFLEHGVDVTADGARCDATFGGASITESDGLLLEARYACPAGARRIEVTLYYLNTLAEGHKEIARIVAPGRSAEGVLTRDRRALALELPSSTPGPRRRSATPVVVLTATFTVFMVGLTLWRWRATRKQRRARAPRPAGRRDATS